MTMFLLIEKNLLHEHEILTNDSLIQQFVITKSLKLLTYKYNIALNRACKKDDTILINSVKGKPQPALVMNENNRVMALLAINVLKDFKQSEFSATYKLLN